MFILNFHGLGQSTGAPISTDAQYWINPLRFAEILELVRARSDVEVTFDDAYESDYIFALPLLKAAELKASFFILAGRIGQAGSLSRKQIESLHAEGMTIGNHGMHHRRWSTLGARELHEEVVIARESIQQIIGAPVGVAACPFGAYNRRVLNALHSEGYQKVYTSDGGAADPQAWIQPRNTLVHGDDGKRVLNLLSEVASGSKAQWRRFKMALKRWR